LNSHIEHISIALPEQIVSNEDLAARFPGWSAEKIEKKLGIKQRHVLADGECPSDIACAAAEKLFNESAIDRSDIDYLIFCTQGPDYLLPTSASIIQDRLGLPKSIGAIDVNQGCSGYIHGLALAKGLVESGVAGKVLLLTADAYSRYVSKDDASVSTIFGDGASATIIGRSTSNGGTIGSFEFGSDGALHQALIVPHSALRGTGHGQERGDLYMDGPGVLSFTLREVPPLVARTLENAQLTMDDIDFVILHQANSFILSQLQRKLAIPDEKMVVDFADVGNTVSSTIPIAFSRQVERGTITRGDRGLLVGFGVGLSWAACIVDYRPL
jgi:3-oxoacyl-[acyl-carrier-protein] synthase-3